MLGDQACDDLITFNWLSRNTLAMWHDPGVKHEREELRWAGGRGGEASGSGHHLLFLGGRRATSPPPPHAARSLALTLPPLTSYPPSRTFLREQFPL